MDQTNPVKRTGMIGLGAMGLQFARHMQRKGFDVAGYDINADAVRRAENDGIRHRGSPAEIGKHRRSRRRHGGDRRTGREPSSNTPA